MAKTVTLSIMDPPYESATSTTAFRLIDAALLKNQRPHPNPVHGTTVEEEQHPNPKDFVAALFELATQHGVRLDWVNCGLCVDERGAGNWIDGARRGGPPDLHTWVQASDVTIVIPTK